MRKENKSTAAVRDSADLFQEGRADVARARERARRRRIVRLFVILAIPDAYLFYRWIDHRPIVMPQISPPVLFMMPVLLFVIVMLCYIGWMIYSSRSPHRVVMPEDIEVGLDDVVGLPTQVEEVKRTLDVFLGYATFREQLGGNPRRGVLFEGPPGTGKTYLAKATAKQAGVPFLFVAAPSFQTVWQGLSQYRVRQFFNALRATARREGGAIGFIEEIDAIGIVRGGGFPAQSTGAGRMTSGFVGTSENSTAMLNQLLIQMQSFDQPAMRHRMKNRFYEWLNGYLPKAKRLPVGGSSYSNILVFAATNRADVLDPALTRPGRFDQRLYFDPPTKQGRRELIDFFLDRKVHETRLDDDDVREQLARDTFGYTPVMLEHLFDEALLLALKHSRREMSLEDVHDAKLTEEVGLKQPVMYSDEERTAIATHEAGHATVAHFLGKDRRLEVLSIIKRRRALGILAHGDKEERFTRTRSELEGLIAIALGGMVSEEIFLGESGTGPASDLSTATELAASMVGELGMAGSLVSYDAMLEGPVSAKNLPGKVLSDPEAKRRVEQILEAQKKRVVEVLRTNSHVVEALRDALVERDELVEDEIGEVIEKAMAGRQKVSVSSTRKPQR